MKWKMMDFCDLVIVQDVRWGKGSSEPTDKLYIFLWKW